MDPKKKRERAVLDLVYADRRVDSILPSEGPDFVVRTFPDNRRIGVEVTELYSSESAARFDRLPHYVGELLDGAPVRHKHDKQHGLTVNVVSEDNVVKARGVRVVLTDSISARGCADLIATRITDKAADLATASNELSHLNLIIRDDTSVLDRFPPEQFYQLCFTPSLRHALGASSFREVFLVTSMTRQLGCVPLKALHLLAEASFFMAMRNEQHTAPPADDLVCFASLLSTAVTTPVLTRREANAAEIIYGDSGLLITGDDEIVIRMYCDHPFPTDAIVATPELASALPVSFRQELDSFRSMNAFTCPLWFPIQHAAP